MSEPLWATEDEAHAEFVARTSLLSPLRERQARMLINAWLETARRDEFLMRCWQMRNSPKRGA